MRRIFIYFFIITLSGSFNSCSKYLDEKPDKSFSTPTTTEDLRLLLDDFNAVNQRCIPFSELMSDNFYVSDETYNSSFTSFEKKYYAWQEDASFSDYWVAGYNVIFQTNIVLDELANLKEQGNQIELAIIRGSAKYFRGYYYWNIAQIYTLPYNSASASNLLGLPLRLSANVNETSKRSTLQHTYDQIIADLTDAVEYLPTNATPKSRPTKQAALGALAKVYLSMGKFDSASKYADLCINSFGGRLLDFNTDISPTSLAPFPDWKTNSEVVIPLATPFVVPLLSSFAIIDTNLIKSYNDHDLRKTAYFTINPDNSYSFKGNVFYANSALENRSISLNDMYLIRAECKARANEVSLAIDDLNFLLSKRWDKNYFQPVSVDNASEALRIILEERRKELLFTGDRWIDIRRFSSNTDYAIVPKRIINGVTYMLEPGSPRFALKIPQAVIELSGMKQNE